MRIWMVAIFMVGALAGELCAQTTVIHAGRIMLTDNEELM